MTLNAFLWLGVLVFLAPVGVFSLQVAMAWISRHSGISLVSGSDGLPSTVILIPAHNEEKVIAQTLAGLGGLSPEVKVLVVADNCTDETAAIARAQGAVVVERSNVDLRGKGYALQHGLDCLRANPPDVVIVLDADCDTTCGDMHRLAVLCADSPVPVQGIYLMHAPPEAGVGSKIAEFAWLVKTMVRPLGWRALGGGCQLMGSGFALPWTVAKDLNLASGHIVEDMKLTLDLAKVRLAPVFVETSRVDSFFPTAVSAQTTQRRRWEHGHLSMVLTEVPFAVLRALRTRNWPLFAVALDLCVPPLSLLVLCLMALSVLSLIQWAIWGITWSGLAALALAVSLALSVLLSWMGWGRAILSPRDISAVPGFVWRKLTVYGEFLWRRERQWTRTDRD